MSRDTSSAPTEIGPSKAESFDHLLPLFSAVTKLRNESLHNASQFIAALGTQWEDIKRSELERNRKENHHYTPLRNITIKETDHSRLLGELLDPHGAHGQDRLFLDSFLDMLGVYKPAEGTWKITIEDDHVDILLRRVDPPSVIIIENKANDAGDQERQLYRYWHKKIHHAYPKLDYRDPHTSECFKIVYAPALSFHRPAADSLQRPSRMEKDLPDYPTLPLPVDYLYFERDVAPWLERMADEVKSSRLKVFLKLYAETWRI